MPRWLQGLLFFVTVFAVWGGTHVYLYYRIKRLIGELSSDIPMFRDTMLSAMGRVIPSHLFDNKLFDFKKLGDTADAAEKNPNLPPVKNPSSGINKKKK